MQRHAPCPRHVRQRMPQTQMRLAATRQRPIIGRVKAIAAFVIADNPLPAHATRNAANETTWAAMLGPTKPPGSACERVALSEMRRFAVSNRRV